MEVCRGRDSPPRGYHQGAPLCPPGWWVVLPALGAYAGGLNVLDRAFRGLFAGALNAFMLGDERVYPVSRRSLRAD